MKRSSPKSFNIFQILLKILFAAAIYAGILSAAFSYFYHNPPKRLERIDLNEELVEEIELAEPTYFFIGNSMLDTRIDEPTLESLLGSDIVRFTNGGSASAKWYLYFKNFVVPSDAERIKAFIFFRDNMLTEPFYRTSGKYVDYINTLKTEDEPVFDLIMSGQGVSYKEKLLSYIHKDAHVDSFQDAISDLSLQVVQAKDGEEFIAQVNDEFALDKLRETEEGDQEEDPGSDAVDFEADLERSFLPEIIWLAKTNDIELVFVRVKKRPDENNITAQSPELETYITALREYIETNDCKLYDFTNDENIPLEWYKDGDHMGEKVQYTNYFYSKLSTEFE